MMAMTVPVRTSFFEWPAKFKILLIGFNASDEEYF